MNKSIRVLLYLPKNRDGSYLDNAIDIHTWLYRWTWQKEVGGHINPALRCSHAELWFPDEQGRYQYETPLMVYAKTNKPIKACGQCYTSTLRDKVNGVAMRPASRVLTTPARWNYFNIELTDSEYESMYNYALFQASQNIRYGKLTIASFFLPFRINEKSCDICSEAVNRALVHGLQVPSHSRLLTALSKIEVPSPLRLASNIFAQGYDLYSLETGEVVLWHNE